MYYHYLALKGIDKTKNLALKGIDKTKTEITANNTVRTITRTCGWAKMHIWPSKTLFKPEKCTTKR